MLRIVTTIVLGAIGGYLIHDAKSKNTHARNEYEDSVDKAQKKTKRAYHNAQKKDMLDKLFKVKRAKQKIADSIYSQLKSSQKNFKDINTQLKESKDTLSTLFMQKKLVSTRDEKKTIQENINAIIEARRELFNIRDELKVDIVELRDRLNKSNKYTRDIQVEIDRVRGN